MPLLLKEIQRQQENFAELAFTKIPGNERVMLSHGKLLAKAIENFHKNPDIVFNGKTMKLREWAKANGFVSSISDQYNQSLDIMATAISNGKISEAFQKIKKLTDQGEVLTGNKLAEEFNRFISADIMRQITDLGIKHGAIQDSRAALAYINTFVNRTQGNYLASQRPLVFQGPIGQAIGLFQTYQFNLLQQLFRYIGEGEAKSALTMMGFAGKYLWYARLACIQCHQYSYPW